MLTEPKFVTTFRSGAYWAVYGLLSILLAGRFMVSSFPETVSLIGALLCVTFALTAMVVASARAVQSFLNLDDPYLELWLTFKAEDFVRARRAS